MKPNRVQLSVVIPTYKRPQSLLHVLGALTQQAVLYDAYEVIVVSDGADRDTAAHLRTLTTPLQLRFIEQPHAGVATARNRGVDAAEGELIVFLDDDVIPSSNLLAAHIAMHAQHGPCAAVFGPLHTPTDVMLQPWVAWEQAQLMDKYDRLLTGELISNPHLFYTGNASLRREHFIEIGGFDVAINRAEDLELAYRLATNGLSFYFCPAAVGTHYPIRTYREWLDIPYTYGQNAVTFAQAQGHVALLNRILAAYPWHHPLTRGVVNAGLDRPAVSRLIVSTLTRIALFAYRTGWQQLSNRAFSGVYNLRRYQGMADAFGGRRAFKQALDSART